ncbi:MAG: ExbD/TolR family protein [Bryobacteraceae bacterium]
MAFSFQNGSGFGGKRRYGSTGAISEMNVVPLVDVVLVLLIIFMLTAHVMEFGLEVEVPKVKQVRESTQELPVVTVSRSGELYLNENPVNINLLSAEVVRQFGDQPVFLRADKGAVWDIVAQVIGVLGDGGVKVNVVTQPEDEASRPRR